MLYLKNFKSTKVIQKHSKTIWGWRNDPGTISMSLTKEDVTWLDHKKWFAKSIDDSYCYQYIITLRNKPVGVVRFDGKIKKNSEYSYYVLQVNINLNPVYRGKKISKYVLSYATKSLRNEISYNMQILAEVKYNNRPSHALFIGSGYKLLKETKSSTLYQYLIEKKGPFVSDFIKNFWEKQSIKGITSGTQDTMADEIEQNAILNELKKIKIKNRILDMGCGDGRLVLEIASLYKKSTIDALDYSFGMIKLAKNNQKKIKLKSKNVKFMLGDIKSIADLPNNYDIIISKRSLINLPSYNQQLQVIGYISQILNRDGYFIMCENSINGLRKINQLRKQLKLNKVNIPWHNIYLDERKIERDVKKLKLIDKIYFSSTYYFLSRIVNAYYANKLKSEINYLSPINQLAYYLPPDLVQNYSQGVIWIWKNKK